MEEQTGKDRLHGKALAAATTALVSALAAEETKLAEQEGELAS